MEEQVACKGLTDEVDTVEVERADVGVMATDEVSRDEEEEKVVSDDMEMI